MLSHPSQPSTPFPIHRPDYAGGSILNLMASVAAAFGVDTGHAPTRLLPPQSLQRSHLVLLVVDGLGLAHLQSAAQAPVLRGLLRGGLTSVFPSTTATAITTFLTGLSPAQHALTGWHVYLREINQVGAVLPFRLRGRESPLSARGMPAARLYDHPALTERLQAACHAVSPEAIAYSEYNLAHTRGATRHTYHNQAGLFEGILDSLAAPGERKFVYAYYPVLDSVAHEHGIASARAAEVLRCLDAQLGRFLEAVAGRDVTVVVSADHGFMDCPESGNLELQHLAQLRATLSRPLCGERRTPFCYLQPEAADRFRAAAAAELAERAHVCSGSGLHEAGWFGPGEAHPEFASRVGDAVLLMAPGYTLKDWVPGEKRHRLIGVHGGASAQEMEVPLLVAEP